MGVFTLVIVAAHTHNVHTRTRTRTRTRTPASARPHHASGNGEVRRLSPAGCALDTPPGSCRVLCSVWHVVTELGESQGGPMRKPYNRASLPP